nr:MAG TPA: hypothetical protein [Caudoviricetes sp.]
MMPHVVAIDLIRTMAKDPYRFYDIIETEYIDKDKGLVLNRIQVMSSTKLLLDYKAPDGEEITKDNIHEAMIKCNDVADDKTWVNSVVVGYNVTCDKKILTILVANDRLDHNGESIDFAHRKDKDVYSPYAYDIKTFKYEGEIEDIANRYIRDTCISPKHFINTPYCENTPDRDDPVWWKLKCYERHQLSFDFPSDIKTLIRILKKCDNGDGYNLGNLDRASYNHIVYAIERTVKQYLADYNDGDVLEALKELV